MSLNLFAAFATEFAKALKTQADAGQTFDFTDATAINSFISATQTTLVNAGTITAAESASINTTAGSTIAAQNTQVQAATSTSYAAANVSVTIPAVTLNFSADPIGTVTGDLSSWDSSAAAIFHWPQGNKIIRVNFDYNNSQWQNIDNKSTEYRHADLYHYGYRNRTFKIEVLDSTGSVEHTQLVDFGLTSHTLLNLNVNSYNGRYLFKRARRTFSGHPDMDVISVDGNSVEIDFFSQFQQMRTDSGVTNGSQQIRDGDTSAYVTSPQGGYIEGIPHYIYPYNPNAYGLVKERISISSSGITYTKSSAFEDSSTPGYTTVPSSGDLGNSDSNNRTRTTNATASGYNAYTSIAPQPVATASIGVSQFVSIPSITINTAQVDPFLTAYVADGYHLPDYLEGDFGVGGGPLNVPLSVSVTITAPTAQAVAATALVSVSLSGVNVIVAPPTVSVSNEALIQVTTAAVSIVPAVAAVSAGAAVAHVAELKATVIAPIFTVITGATASANIPPVTLTIPTHTLLQTANVSVNIAYPNGTPGARSLVVTKNTGGDGYYIDGVLNPTLYLPRGVEYTFVKTPANSNTEFFQFYTAQSSAAQNFKTLTYTNNLSANTATYVFRAVDQVDPIPSTAIFEPYYYSDLFGTSTYGPIYFTNNIGCRVEVLPAVAQGITGTDLGNLGSSTLSTFINLTLEVPTVTVIQGSLAVISDLPPITLAVATPSVSNTSTTTVENTADIVVINPGVLVSVLKHCSIPSISVVFSPQVTVNGYAICDLTQLIREVIVTAPTVSASVTASTSATLQTAASHIIISPLGGLKVDVTATNQVNANLQPIPPSGSATGQSNTATALGSIVVTKPQFTVNAEIKDVTAPTNLIEIDVQAPTAIGLHQGVVAVNLPIVTIVAPTVSATSKVEVSQPLQTITLKLPESEVTALNLGQTAETTLYQFTYAELLNKPVSVANAQYTLWDAANALIVITQHSGYPNSAFLNNQRVRVYPISLDLDINGAPLNPTTASIASTPVIDEYFFANTNLFYATSTDFYGSLTANALTSATSSNLTTGVIQTHSTNIILDTESGNNRLRIITPGYYQFNSSSVTTNSEYPIFTDEWQIVKTGNTFTYKKIQYKYFQSATTLISLRGRTSDNFYYAHYDTFTGKYWRRAISAITGGSGYSNHLTTTTNWTDTLAIADASLGSQAELFTDEQVLSLDIAFTRQQVSLGLFAGTELQSKISPPTPTVVFTANSTVLSVPNIEVVAPIAKGVLTANATLSPITVEPIKANGVLSVRLEAMDVVAPQTTTKVTATTVLPVIDLVSPTGNLGTKQHAHLPSTVVVPLQSVVTITAKPIIPVITVSQPEVTVSLAALVNVQPHSNIIIDTPDAFAAADIAECENGPPIVMEPLSATATGSGISTVSFGAFPNTVANTASATGVANVTVANGIVTTVLPTVSVTLSASASASLEPIIIEFAPPLIVGGTVSIVDLPNVSVHVLIHQLNTANIQFMHLDTVEIIPPQPTITKLSQSISVSLSPIPMISIDGAAYSDVKLEATRVIFVDSEDRTAFVDAENRIILA